MASDQDRRILVAALNEITELIRDLARINMARAQPLMQDQKRIADRLKALMKDET